MRSFFPILFLFATLSIYAQENVKIAIISDVHYLSPSLARHGKALSEFENSTDRNVQDLHAVFNKVLKDIEKENPDILLIPGDLTNHGEKDSHINFRNKLLPLIKKGTQVLVIPGNHDINVPSPMKYIRTKPEIVDNISASEFADIYASMGYGNALKRDVNSLSYLAIINDSIWMLCIDTNLYDDYKTSTISAGRISSETLTWAIEILKEAKENNIKVLGMMHHGLVEHMPYQNAFFSEYLIKDWASAATILANAGLRVVFTGHFHSNDITEFITKSGNSIYDVETGSLAQFPFPYRIMELRNDSLNISTRFVESIPLKPNLAEEYRIKLEKRTRAIANAKISGLGFGIIEKNIEALVNVIVKMNLDHVRGDETLDAEMIQFIERFGYIMGDDGFDFEHFKLDYPPADNNTVIFLGDIKIERNNHEESLSADSLLTERSY